MHVAALTRERGVALVVLLEESMSPGLLIILYVALRMIWDGYVGMMNGHDAALLLPGLSALA